MSELDPRAAFLAAAGSVVLISSTEPAHLRPFAAYVPLTLAIASRVPWRQLSARILLGLPFIVIAAMVFALGAGWERGVSVGLKGVCALALAGTLSLSTPIPQLLWALRRLGAPSAVNLISGLMLRYIDMLQEELGRMERARLSRCGAPVAGWWLFQSHGAIVGALLVRSWERADRIHAAMVSRGFSGVMPETRHHHWRLIDSGALAAILLSFAAARFLL